MILGIQSARFFVSAGSPGTGMWGCKALVSSPSCVAPACLKLSAMCTSPCSSHEATDVTSALQAVTKPGSTDHLVIRLQLLEPSSGSLDPVIALQRGSAPGAAGTGQLLDEAADGSEQGAVDDAATTVVGAGRAGDHGVGRHEGGERGGGGGGRGGARGSAALERGEEEEGSEGSSGRGGHHTASHSLTKGARGAHPK